MRINIGPSNSIGSKQSRLKAVCALAGGGVLVTACAVLRPARPPTVDASLSGTYRIEICRGPCSGRPGDSVVARGHLVVERRGYSVSSLPARARALAEREVFLRVRVPDEVVDPNACFAFERRPHQAGEIDSFAEALEVGFTLAALRRDSLLVGLYHSPDAGYYTVLGRAGDELWGRAHYWGSGDAADESPDEGVIARRIGPPDRGICIRAAEERPADR